MTKLLEQAIAQVRALPDDEQDEAAEILLSVLSKRSEPVNVDNGTWQAIGEGLKEADRGEFVSDEDMAEFFKRHGV